MRFLSLFLSSFIAFNPLWAQSGSGIDAELHVHLIDDPGPAKPHTTSTKGYVLQVTSAVGAPVAGAAVALRLPEDGATGRFSNGLRAWVAYSDSAGIAQFPGIQWGDIAGDVELKITAARGASHAQFLIAQHVGSDTGSVTVASVPHQPPAPPAKNPPAVDSVIVAVAKPAPAPMPAIELPALRSSVTYKSLADVVPQSETPKPAPATSLPTQQPGTLAQPKEESSPATTSRSGSAPADDKQHPLAPNPPPPAKDGEPTVTITNAPTGAGGSESHKKMWLLVGIGGGAAAAALFGILAAHAGGGAAGGATTSSSGITIGAPTITVGH